MEPVAIPNGWNADVLRLGGDFLQSWEWGTFQEAVGAEVVRLRSDNALAQLVRRSLPFGKSYWYCPRGPLGAGAAEELSRSPSLTGAAFLRFEPQASARLPARARRAHDVQPGQTRIVDLDGDPESLLSAMHEKWRYNIRLAERKGVRVFMAGLEDPNSADIFWELLSETAGRDGFSTHDREYYARMLVALAGDPAADGPRRPVARLIFAEHDGRVLAANLMLYFGTAAVYLHGASSRIRREVMAPQALHWRAMLDAKAWGYRAYDFWGVAPEGATRHPLLGVTRFKNGFGGRYVQYPGTYDLPLDRFWYAAYALAQRLRGR